MLEEEFLKNISKFIEKKSIIAIDGRCASGKTTLAEKISNIYDVDIIHMDDFFLPRELRYEKRLSECGGNVHYERFYEEVISNLKNKNMFSYRIFQCKSMQYIASCNVYNKKAIIIEGAYSLRPEFRYVYDLKVFKDISKEKQSQRIIKRNGLDKYRIFENQWIPKEEEYFKEFSIKDCSDIVIN